MPPSDAEAEKLGKGARTRLAKMSKNMFGGDQGKTDEPVHKPN